jgi:Protein of unknown function (DUF3800)
VYLCYIDESGTPELPGTSSHFILAGISLPVWRWQNADREVTAVLQRYGLADKEMHTAWILRAYLEQSRIPGFAKFDWAQRRAAVFQKRTTQLLALQKAQNSKAYKQAKKNYRHTEPYIHLTHDERVRLVREVADVVGGWGFARIFAECIDKSHFNPVKTTRPVAEQALEQVVSRFDRYLQNTAEDREKNYGLLVHDNNPTVAQRHSELVREFHRAGTLWTNVTSIIETPMFVESSLTRMIQVADLCAYALRRYCENQEGDLFTRIYPRADRISGGTVVGVRHFSTHSCACEICKNHRAQSQTPTAILS